MGAVTVTRWDSANRPSEEQLRQLLSRENLEAHKWSNGNGDTYSAHDHRYHKVIYVVEGSIVFAVPGTGEEILLRAGDRLDLPAGTVHSARVGPEGVVCLEAHSSS